MAGRSTSRREELRWWLVTMAPLVVLLLAVLLVLALAGGAEAQTNNSTVAPIYNNTTVTVVDNTTWMENRTTATIGNVTSYVVDIGPFAIGSGPNSSEGVQGALLTGLLVFGAVMSVTGRSRPGMVAGAVIAAMTVATLVEVALSPLWVLFIVVLAVGILLARALLHVLR